MILFTFFLDRFSVFGGGRGRGPRTRELEGELESGNLCVKLINDDGNLCTCKANKSNKRGH